MRGDEEYPFSGVTKSGRVWRRVPKSDVRSVPSVHTSGTDANSSAHSCRGAVPEGGPCTQLRHGAVTSRAQTGPDEALSRQDPRNGRAVESSNGTPK